MSFSGKRPHFQTLLNSLMLTDKIQNKMRFKHFKLFGKLLTTFFRFLLAVFTLIYFSNEVEYDSSPVKLINK
jgi:hypothetical protein